jgi:ketopantoate hydroxymethyltransferase
MHWPADRRVTVHDLQAATDRGERWSMLTSYDALTARIFEQSGVRALLVGDTSGMMVFGHETTVPVTLAEDALALEQAGVFAIVLEAVPAELGARVSAALRVPTVGIGAGAACDAQIMVWQDRWPRRRRTAPSPPLRRRSRSRLRPLARLPARHVWRRSARPRPGPAAPGRGRGPSR